jgi:hypothetical protein
MARPQSPERIETLLQEGVVELPGDPGDPATAAIAAD